MRVLVQRVSRAQVSVAGQIKGRIGPGLVLLVGVHQNDSTADAQFCAEKCANLRIFADTEGKMNRSVLDISGGILAISQFTLYGDSRRGRRPGFSNAAPPNVAEPLYRHFVQCLQKVNIAVAEGVFGANMQVEIHNDGPVTLIVESP